MTKEEIFQYFYTNSANLGIKNILIIMAAGLGISLIISLVYYLCYRGVAYNGKFNLSLIVIMLVSVVLMMMISSNIVISLGMVGALSIVRFRTAVKDSRDTVFIFWAITEGLCVGSQNFKLALFTSLFIAIVMLAICLKPRIVNKYLLIINGEGENLDVASIFTQINSHVLYSRLRTANRTKQHQEYIFEVRTKGEISADLLIAVSSVEGVKGVNWVAEYNGNIG